MSAAPQGFRPSPQQERLWRRIAAESGGAAGATPFVARCRIEIRGPLDRAALARALARLAAEHEILRTGFRVPPGMQRPLQEVSGAARFPLDEGDLAALGALEPPDDLSRPPLAVARLADDGSGRAWLEIALPSLLADEAALDLLALALAEAYAAECGGKDQESQTGSPDAEPQLPPLQYADLADWQCELLEREDTAAGRAYWTAERVPPMPLDELALDLARTGAAAPAPADGARFDGRPLALAAATAERLRPLAAAAGDVFLAAWATLAMRVAGWGGRDEVAIGVSFDGRKFAELASALGPFARRIPVPLDLPASLPFREAVARATAAREERAKFEEVFAPGDLDADLPLAFVALGPRARAEAGGVSFAVTSRRAVLDLPLAELAVEVEIEVRRPLALELRVDAARLDAATAARLGERLLALLDGAAADPDARLSDLPILGAAERRELVLERNADRRDFGPVRTLHGLVAAQARATPAAPAVESDGEALTYAELLGRANALAAALVARGVRRGDRVALCLERSVDMVVGLLGILAAGAAYLPLEPTAPRARRERMLADAGAAFLVLGPGAPDESVDGFADQSVDGAPSAVGRLPRIDLRVRSNETPPDLGVVASALVDVGPEDLAYVIFTSGSTGRPKGVAVAHGAICNRLLWMQADLPIGPGDAVLHKTPFGFDASIWEIFVPLATGARLILARPGAHGDVAELARVAFERGATVLQLVPSLLGPFLAAEEWARLRGRLRRLYCGGEALPADLAARARERLGVAPINLYGPTEAAIDAASFPSTGAEATGIVPIGRPIANDRLFLLDRQGALLPRGAAGEIAIGGAGLAIGYVGRPDLTAERFVPDGVSTGADSLGARLYRTGDLGRMRADGAIEFLGRIDQQVKIRGVRVEPGEVEAELTALAGVAEAAVAACEMTPGDLQLVGYLVAAREGNDGIGARLDLPALAARLGAVLPEAMVPSHWVELPALPRTPSGKIDRGALPAPVRSSVGATYVAPRTPTEQMLADRLAEILGVPRLGVEDDVFDLGFHSLHATQLGARLRRMFGLDLPLRSLFELPRVALLAARIDAGLRADPRLAAPPLVRAERSPAGEPLSFAQRRLWFLDQMQPGSPFYNIALALALDGRLDLPAFSASVSELVRRHEALRTTFAEVDAEPVQRIADPSPVPIPRIDLSGLSAPTAERARLVAVEALAPFDLEAGPLLRVRLLELAAESHLALVTVHHIVSDGWSTGLLTRELAALYGAFSARRSPALAPPPLQYADFARWQRRYLEGDALAALEEHWLRELGDAPASLELPADRPRPLVQSFRGVTRSRQLGGAAADGLSRLARREGATLFMVALAATGTLLGWLAGVDDLVLGTDVASRDRAEVEGTVGFFVNQLALRLRLDGDPSFLDLLSRVRERTLAAYAHQDLPFDRLVERLNPERSRARAPIFQAKVNLHNLEAPSLELPGLAITALAPPRATAQFDWILNLTPLPDGLVAALEANADLFEPSTVERMLTLFEGLIDAVVERPEARLSELGARLAELEAAARDRSTEERRRERQSQMKTVRRQAVDVGSGA